MYKMLTNYIERAPRVSRGSCNQVEKHPIKFLHDGNLHVMRGKGNSVQCFRIVSEIDYKMKDGSYTCSSLVRRSEL